jgi:MYXO-CTERM domain-containing protein
MRRTGMLAVLMIAAAAGSPAQAQQRDTGVPTETQVRLAEPSDRGFDWNWLGLLGLIGLLGLRRGHTEDGYHPAPLE